MYPEKDGLEFLALRALREKRREYIEEETVLRACIALDAAKPKGKSIDGDWYMGWNVSLCETRANGFAYGIPMKRDERLSHVLKIINVSVGEKPFSIKL